MITVAIREMAEKRGITTAYQLMKAASVQPSMAAKWWSNDLEKIGINTLDLLCTVLKCKPNDLLRFELSEGAESDLSVRVEESKPTKKANAKRG